MTPIVLLKFLNGKVQTAVLSTHVKAGPWKITQYGSEKKNRQTFYTVTNSFGDLVIIDGGSRSNSRLVLKTITEHGGRVKAWILTHPHVDHAGAFMKLMRTKKTASLINIEKVYVCPVSAAKLKKIQLPGIQKKMQSPI